MTRRMGLLRAGVYVDVENTVRNGGRGLRFDALRDFARRDGAEAVRLNAYLTLDEDRAGRDPDYRARAARYHFAIRDVGFRIVEKPIVWLQSDDGSRIGKVSADLDLAVDMILQAPRLDRVVLVTGDGDFTRVVRALQTAGCRVELIGFHNVSSELRGECDLFLPGFLLPGLLPAPARLPAWGEVGSRVRGTCYHYNAEKGFGFLRYLSRLGDFNVTATADPDCPYREAFFHCSHCPPGLDLTVLPNRDLVFEFTLTEGREGKAEAEELTLLASYSPQVRLGPESREPRPPRPAPRPTADAPEPRGNGGERPEAARSDSPAS